MPKASIKIVFDIYQRSTKLPINLPKRAHRKRIINIKCMLAQGSLCIQLIKKIAFEIPACLNCYLRAMFFTDSMARCLLKLGRYQEALPFAWKVVSMIRELISLSTVEFNFLTLFHYCYWKRSSRGMMKLIHGDHKNIIIILNHLSESTLNLVLQ